MKSSDAFAFLSIRGFRCFLFVIKIYAGNVAIMVQKLHYKIVAAVFSRCIKMVTAYRQRWIVYGLRKYNGSLGCGDVKFRNKEGTDNDNIQRISS